ncbi:MAG: galactose mutarotase [Clostridiales bacterium]|nr:galactose mutarotase [Clostridiales bacterium]
MAVTVKPYDSVKYPGKYTDVSKMFTMDSPFGLKASIITYGCIITELWVPDKNGELADVMLGLKGLDEYMIDGANHGAVVGRSANRIANATFTLNGKEYHVPVNDGIHNLHSGNPGFHNQFWEGSVLSTDEVNAYIKDSGIPGIPAAAAEGICLKYTSPDGATGFPGNLDATVVYAFLEDKTFLILYKGVSDQDTIFAPTNHAYFNLSGHDHGYIGNNILTVYADKVTTKDKGCCPTGEFFDVEGTDFDFRNGAPVKQAIDSSDPQITDSCGLDSNFCVDSEEGTYSKIAVLADDSSSRVMEVFTDLPGVQLYTGNHLDCDYAKGGSYKANDGICLEAQMYPNAINIPSFTSPVIKAGEVCYHACGYRFV